MLLKIFVATLLGAIGVDDVVIKTLFELSSLDVDDLTLSPVYDVKFPNVGVF